MNELTQKIKAELVARGADLVGFGDLTGLPAEVRENMPVGIIVALKYPAEIIQGIAELPTPEYHAWYNRLNERLDNLVTYGAEHLRSLGYEAFAQTRERVGKGEQEDRTTLPHKTIATRAGLGWIGKSALLVTPTHGSMIRLSSILTNAPLDTAEPVNTSKCGKCTICRDACPAGAISGNEWQAGLPREELIDTVICRKAAVERSLRGFGGGDTICGKCIEVCPHTRKNWK